jgi:hypothetical protein
MAATLHCPPLTATDLRIHFNRNEFFCGTLDACPLRAKGTKENIFVHVLCVMNSFWYSGSVADTDPDPLLF